MYIINDYYKTARKAAVSNTTNPSNHEAVASPRRSIPQVCYCYNIIWALLSSFQVSKLLSLILFWSDIDITTAIWISDLDMAGLNREASVFVPRRCRSGYDEYERLGIDIGIDDRVKPAFMYYVEQHVFQLKREAYERVLTQLNLYFNTLVQDLSR